MKLKASVEQFSTVHAIEEHLRKGKNHCATLEITQVNQGVMVLQDTSGKNVTVPTVKMRLPYNLSGETEDRYHFYIYWQRH